MREQRKKRGRVRIRVRIRDQGQGQGWGSYRALSALGLLLVVQQAALPVLRLGLRGGCSVENEVIVPLWPSRQKTKWRKRRGKRRGGGGGVCVCGLAAPVTGRQRAAEHAERWPGTDTGVREREQLLLPTSFASSSMNLFIFQVGWDPPSQGGMRTPVMASDIWVADPRGNGLLCTLSTRQAPLGMDQRQARNSQTNRPTLLFLSQCARSHQSVETSTW
jgi:hypothetical protein